MLGSFSARGALPPWDPLPGHCPWTPLGACAAPRPPAQLGPMDISADGPSAHQQKFPTISLHIIIFYSDFIWDFGKLPFPTHLGKYFIKNWENKS